MDASMIFSNGNLSDTVKKISFQNIIVLQWQVTKFIHWRVQQHQPIKVMLNKSNQSGTEVICKKPLLLSSQRQATASRRQTTLVFRFEMSGKVGLHSHAHSKWVGWQHVWAYVFCLKRKLCRFWRKKNKNLSLPWVEPYEHPWEHLLGGRTKMPFNPQDRVYHEDSSLWPS